MRSWVCVALFALCCVVAVQAQADADDAALLQLGIDLSAHSAAAPMPTYVTSKPLGHDAATIAKFPMLHEIKGLEAKDWSDIQSLLFREPPAAAESNLDMKLDELEVKFNKLDTKPVPSPIAPKGSTLLPNLNKPEMGLRATLPKKRGKKGLRMKQKGKKGKKSKKAAAKKAASKAQAKAAAPAAAAKPAAPAKAPAASAPAAATSEAASTVRLIEKRIKGLSQLFSRLKTQIGIDAAKAKKAKKAGKKGKKSKKSGKGKKSKKGSKAGKSSKPKKKLSDTQLINNALSKHRKDKKELARRMAARRARFAQVDMEAEGEAEGQSEADVEAEVEAEAEAESEVDSEADSEAEAETEQEVESEAESEQELAADAEAIDDIMHELM